MMNFIFTGQTSCAITCNVDQEKRVLCGSLHPTEQDCINRGCCFDVKIKSCFLKLYGELCNLLLCHIIDKHLSKFKL